MSFEELPEEICIKIWSSLDFHTVQKTCSLVCHGWFKTIRNSGKLSGQLALNLEPMFKKESEKRWKKRSYNVDFLEYPSTKLKGSILSRWKQLHTLRFRTQLDDGVFDLTTISSLHKGVFL